MQDRFESVGIVGAGTMGAGIAEVVAAGGANVRVVDIDADALRRGQAAIEKSSARAVDAGKLTAESRDLLLSRITYSGDLQDLADAGLVIEAVPERADVKRGVFEALNKVCGPTAVLASATSSLSITELALAAERPGQVVGLHFINPAPIVKLVEVIPTSFTDAATLAAVTDYVTDLGKTVLVVPDREGSIVTALLGAYLNRAVAMLEEGYATRDDIDVSMQYACGMPIGPLTMLDLIGLDTAHDMLEVLYSRTTKRELAPRPLFRQMIGAGWTGKKAGRGFYTYGDDGRRVSDGAVTVAATSASVAEPTIKRVGVVGSGTMASGIIESFAKAGFDVVFVARSKEKIDAVNQAVGKSIARAVERGKSTPAERDAALERITGSVSLSDLADTDLVVEAIIEELGPKLELFAELDRVCAPHTVLATNSSSLSVIACASATSRPDRVIGMHFHNPAPVMKLLEVIHTVETSPEAEAVVFTAARRIGKHPVRCSDRAGFIVNLLLFPYLNEAAKLLTSAGSSIDEVNSAIKLSVGYPMGPFQLIDLIGVDVVQASQRNLVAEFRDPSFAPAPILAQLVSTGRVGRKAGKGFHQYAK